MELNGLINIKLLIDRAAQSGEINEGLHSEISNEVDVLQRYLVAHNADPEVTWKDVRNDPQNWPTLWDWQRICFSLSPDDIKGLTSLEANHLVFERYRANKN